MPAGRGRCSRQSQKPAAIHPGILSSLFRKVKSMKAIHCLLLALLCAHLAPAAVWAAGDTPAGRMATAPADSIPPDHSEMRDISSYALSQEMVPGWNLGNSLEAIGSETAWGNPKVTQRFIDSVKAAGFKSVRIPVAWSRFTDQAAYTIDPLWLDRVEEVVNYVLNNGMYAMINEHWDNGWTIPTYVQQESVNKRLAAMWQQIAVRFRDYDDHLIFAGTNEVHVDYNTPTAEYYTVQNGYNQTFVRAVRSTGGRNAFRYLAVQGYNTNIDYTNRFFVMPADPEPSRLLVEVHYYDPYNFTINSSSTITQWGKNATNPAKTETWANEAWADAQFQKMKVKFIDKGFGVLLGEYGAQARLNLGSAALNQEHAAYRLYWMQYITRSLERHGLVPMYWDNGPTGNNSMGLFNRATGARVWPDIIKALVDTSSLNSTGVQEPPLQLPLEGALQQNYPNPFNPSTTFSFTIPVPAYVTLKVLDLLGREVATLVAESLPAGTWTRQWNAVDVAGGLYIYQIRAGAFAATRKLIVLH